MSFIPKNMNHVENILDLPLEILLLIFEYLLPSDRRIASECCRKLLDIWLHNKFIGDRRLVFYDTTFKDPETILAFVGTQRMYDHLVLTIQGEYFARELAFWNKLGESVTNIEFHGLNCWPNPSFWKMFPKLKVLTIEDTDSSHLDHLPKSLELISLDGVPETDLQKLNVEYLRQKSVPINIELKHVELSSDVVDFINENQQSIVEIETNSISFVQYESLKAPNLKKLKFKSLNGSEFPLIEEKFPHLQCLDLTVYVDLPLQNWKFLKKLTVSILSVDELKQLAMYENFEELDLELTNSNETDCFFVHDPFLNKNLKTLKFKFYLASPCSTCFESMTKTFPNIEKLSLTMNINNGHLKVLKENVTQLRSLAVDRAAGLTLSFEEFPNLSELRLTSGITVDANKWPLMPHLRTLELKVNEENVKIFEQTPALEHLEFGLDSMELKKLSEMVENMLKLLKRLRLLKLMYSIEGNPDLEMIENDLKEHVKKHSKYITQTSIYFHEYV